MLHNESYFESHDGTKLFLYRWSPDTEVKAILHIVHGMAEHALRYKRLAEKLTNHGIEVWAADMRGHGRTANLSINKPNSGGLLGHCASGKFGSDKSYELVTKDIHEINKRINQTKKSPLFLLGHSWGSFIVQNYIEEYTGSGSSAAGTNVLSYEADKLPLIKGCILSGTKGPGDILIKIGKPFLTGLAFFRGQKNGSGLAQSMADGKYNKPFAPNRTVFDWLSRDEEEVNKYIDDPLCGFLCSSGFYRDLTGLLDKIHRKDQIKKINCELPMYVFSGNADPVGGMGLSVTELVNVYRNHGIKDLEFVLYPGARHETLNETNREEVMNNLLAWITRHLE